MKNLIFSLAVLASLGTFVSCSNQNTNTETVANQEPLQNPTTLTVSIDGMTCAMGCAAAIEKECAKLAGVGESKVDFGSKTGTFVYDAAKLQESDIIKCIENTNGGGAYKATVVTDTEDAEDIEASHEAPTTHGSHS